MILSNPAHVFLLNLKENAVTTQPTYFVDYATYNGTAFAAAEVSGIANNLSNVTLLSGPTAGYTQVKSLSVFNGDTVAHTVSVFYSDGTNSRIVSSILLQPSEAMQWSEQHGWSKQYSAFPVTTDSLKEGATNLYFTAARVIAALVGQAISFTSVYITSGLLFSNPPGTSAIDNSMLTVVPAGGTVDFPNFSGIIVTDNSTNGNCQLYLCGGGSVTTLGPSGPLGTLAYQGSIDGYRFTNTTSGSVNMSFMAIRTRPDA